MGQACGKHVKLRTVRSVLNRAIQGCGGLPVELSERLAMFQGSKWRSAFCGRLISQSEFDDW
jgi:hypothetical protein